MSDIDAWDIVLAGVVGDVVVQRAGQAQQARTHDDVVRRGRAAAQVAQYLGHATPEQLQHMAEAKLVMDAQARNAAARAQTEAVFAAGAGVLLIVIGVWVVSAGASAAWLLLSMIGALLLLGALDQR
jgi:hypothetical protein